VGTGRIGRITPSGSVIEFALANSASQPFAIVTGPDRNLWFTEAGADAVGHAVIARPIWA
jgi:virginiamycin B lyase